MAGRGLGWTEDGVAGGGEMGRLLQDHDWSDTPLGPIAGWPQSLKIAVRILLDSRYPMFVWWGPELTNIYNDAYKPTLGTRHPSALGQSAAVVWSEIWDVIGPQTEMVLRQGRATWNRELLLFLERNGYPEETYHTFSYSPVPNDDQAIGGVFCAVIEDTERVLGQRRLRTMRELAARTTEARTVKDACSFAAETLAANPHDLPFSLIYLVDGDGGAARLAGATGLPEGSPARVATIRLAPESGDEPAWPLNDVLATGKARVVEGLETRFGRLECGVWPEPPQAVLTLPMMHSGQDRLAGFLVAGISPRRALDDDYRGFLELLAGQIATAIANARAYEEERKRAEALAELDRAKTTFFSNVSHEFRTPLTLMLGPAEDALSESEEPLPPRQRERVQILHRNALRLLKLVNTLLDFSRIEAGRIQALYEPTDLAALTADLASVFRSAVERAGMRLLVDCPRLPTPVHVDRDMWEKIVLNLLSNAFKYTLEGEIGVAIRPAQGAVELEVRDTGTGIPPHELPHLFERFHRVAGARGRTHEGTGIGLALVQELAKLHGGSVTVRSTPGEGSVFTVSIPLGTAHLPADRIHGTRSQTSTALGATPYVEEALRWLPEAMDREPLSQLLGTDHAGISRHDEHPATRGDAQRPRILLADDNADMREYVRRLLSERYDVEAVSDGRAALLAAQERACDMVITDVMMPGLDGFGLLRGLRARKATAMIPIIMLSARAGEESRVEGLEAGADDYLIKPFSARELMARVAAHLELARVRREAARRERELRAEAEGILESITDGFLALDRDWRFTYANAEAERILGARRGDLLGRSHWEYFPATVGTRLEAEFRRAVADRVSVQFENYYEPWGCWFEVRAYPSRDGGLAIYFRDVTERKRSDMAEQLLAQASATFAESLDVDANLKRVARQLVPSFADFCVFDLVSRDGQIHRVGWAHAVPAEEKALEELMRFVPRRVSREHPVARVLASGRAEFVPEASDEWLRASASSAEHLRLLRTLDVGSLMIVPLSARERTLGALTLCRTLRSGLRYGEADLAVAEELGQRAAAAIDNARLYESAHDALAEAEAANRMKDQFLATLSHELRTPLNAIVGWTRLLRSGRLDNHDMKEGLETIDRNAKVQAQLIEDLLDVSRIISGTLRLDVQRVSLPDVIDAALGSVAPAAEARGVRIVKILDSLAGAVSGDPARLQQVVWNLLSNAVKFTPRGGRIQVLLERVNSHVEISVTDSGVGIKPEFLPYVFDRFRQADASSTRRHGGLGLGLSIVKQLVEMHGGSVRAKSLGENQGSTFVVSLPITVVHEAEEEGGRVRPKEPAEGETECASASLEGVRVLVVDDEPDARDLIRRVLVDCRAEVDVASSVPEALAILDRHRPHVLVSDIGLPEEDGYDLIRAVRARGQSVKEVPAIALTAFARPEDRRRAMLAGFQVHVSKPVDPEELTAIVASLVGRTGSH